MARWVRRLFITSLAGLLLLQAGTAATDQNAPATWARREGGALFWVTIASDTGEQTGSVATMAMAGGGSSVALVANGTSCSLVSYASEPLGSGAHPNDQIVNWAFSQGNAAVAHDAVNVDIAWERNVNRPGEPWISNSGRRRAIRARDGDKVMLDYVSIPPELGLDKTCDSVKVEASVQLFDPGYMSVISYDLWLVQAGRDGDRFERFHTIGRPGHPVEYFFHPKQVPSAGSQLTATVEGRADVTYSGDIRGYTRPDGRLDLALTMGRGVSVGTSEHGRAGGISIASSGRKLLTIGPGETIEVDVPAISRALPGMPNLTSLLESEKAAIRISARRVK